MISLPPNISLQRTVACAPAAELGSFGVGSKVRTLIAALIISGGLVPIIHSGEATGSARAFVEVRSGNLGWDGIWLGATRRDVQTALRRAIEPAFDENTMACGEFRSKLVVSGHAVEIQWSSKDLDGRVDSLAVVLSPADVKAGGKCSPAIWSTAFAICA